MNDSFLVKSSIPRSTPLFNSLPIMSSTNMDSSEAAELNNFDSKDNKSLSIFQIILQENLEKGKNMTIFEYLSLFLSL